MPNTSQKFLADLWSGVLEEVHERRNLEGAGDVFARTTKREILVEKMGEILIENGAAPDLKYIYLEEVRGARKATIDAYWVEGGQEEAETGLTLHLLLLSGMSGALNPALSISTESIKRKARKAARVLEWCAAGTLSRDRSETPRLECIEEIQGALPLLNQVVIHVCHCGSIPTRISVREKWGIDAVGLPVSLDLWDLGRFERASSSNRPYEAIEVNFVEFGGLKSVEALKVHEECDSYDAYLTAMPATLLADLYEVYGAQLMELNVRSFLQARGKVNKGIRDTIVGDPARFFVYNNGLCLTAEEVLRDRDVDSGIVRIHGFKGMQIVNGGQTVASLHRASRLDNASLDGIWVQVKVTEVFGDGFEELVPLISRYSNTQNAVRETDFSSNDPFHVELERLSQRVWCPGEGERWFYERSRGAYQVSKSQKTTPAAKREFGRVFPPRKKFEKVHVAKWEHSSLTKPHWIGLGNQKNFLKFMAETAPRNAEEVTEQYFKDTIAKGIIYKEAESQTRAQKIPAYRANIEAYAIALLWDRYGKAINLSQIWQDQKVPEALSTVIGAWVPLISEELRRSAGERNVTEWCKKEECWSHMRVYNELPNSESLGAASVEAVTASSRAVRGKKTGDNTPEYEANLRDFSQISRAELEELYSWVKRNEGNLGLKEIDHKILATLVGYKISEKPPSVKQAKRFASSLRLFEENRHAG